MKRSPSASAALPTRLRPARFHSRHFGLARLGEAMADVVQSIMAEQPESSTPTTVVDLGCGDTPYRPLFEPYAVTYLGADLEGNAMADVVLDEASGTVDLPDAVADIIVSTQVLEHVRSPRRYLEEAQRLCRPKGRLILSTHGFFKHHPHPTDFRRWTAEGLRQELAEAGWRTERMIGVLGFAAAAFQLLQDAIVLKLPRVRPVRSATAVSLQQVVGLLDALYTAEGRLENAAVYLVVATPDADPSSAGAAA
jgi:SAM-dependent methyltransferase